jgi:hypothetical protein
MTCGLQAGRMRVTLPQISLPILHFAGLWVITSMVQSIVSKLWNACANQQSTAIVCSVSLYFTAWAEVGGFFSFVSLKLD